MDDQEKDCFTENEYISCLEQEIQQQNIPMCERTVADLFRFATFEAEPKLVAETICEICTCLSRYWRINPEKELPAFYCYAHIQEIEKISAFPKEKKCKLYARMRAILEAVATKFNVGEAFQCLHRLPLLDVMQNTVSTQDEKLPPYLQLCKRENYVAQEPIWLQEEKDAACTAEEQKCLLQMGATYEDMQKAKEQDALFVVFGPKTMYPLLLCDAPTAFLLAKQTKADTFTVEKCSYASVKLLQDLLTQTIEANPQFTFCYLPKTEEETKMCKALSNQEPKQGMFYFNTDHKFLEPNWMRLWSKRPYTFDFYASVDMRDQPHSHTPPFSVCGVEYRLILKDMHCGPLQNLLYLQRDQDTPKLIEANVGGVFYQEQCPYVLYTYMTFRNQHKVAYSLLTGEKTGFTETIDYPFSLGKHVKTADLPDFIKLGYLYKNTKNELLFVAAEVGERVGGVYFPREDLATGALCKIAYDLYQDCAVLYDYTQGEIAAYITFVEDTLSLPYRVVADASIKQNCQLHVPQTIEEQLSVYKDKEFPAATAFEFQCKSYAENHRAPKPLLQKYSWEELCKTMPTDLEEVQNFLDNLAREAEAENYKNDWRTYTQYACLSDLVFKTAEDANGDACINAYLRALPINRASAEELIDAVETFDFYRFYEKLLLELRDFLSEEEIQKYSQKCRETFVLPVPTPEEDMEDA